MCFLCELLELVVVAIIVSSLAIIVVQRPINYFGKKLYVCVFRSQFFLALNVVK